MMAMYTYKKAERFILSREFFGMKLGLDNIRDFLTQIDNPQDKYATIHIAGTNGKGSVAAMLASILSEAGYCTGLFTSPHLIDFRERVRVDGEKISKQSVIGFVRRHKSVLVKKNSLFSRWSPLSPLNDFNEAGSI